MNVIRRFTLLASWLKLELWKESRLSFLLALIHCLTVDFVCYYIYSGSNAGFAIQAAIISVATAWPLFYLISWANKYARWIYVSLFVIDGLTAYFVWTYKLEVRADTLALMYESNLQEANAFIGLPLISWVLLCIGTAFLIARRSTKSSLSLVKRCKIFFVLLLLAVPAYRMLKHLDYRMPKPLPVSVAQESQRYFKEKKRLKKMLSSKINIGKTLTSKPHDAPTIVLVIGESARSDHFSLNGYSRETNPELKRRDVLSYTNVTSCDNKTRIAVPCMLTRNTVNNHSTLLSESSLVSLFRSAGFSTAWHSSQRVMHENDTVTTSIANEAETLYFSKLSYNNVQDGYLLPKIQDFISAGDNAKMLVVHTLGSHWAYDHRYDKAHEIFKPACHDSMQRTCSAESLANAYDNSIAYTDWFLATIIDSLEARNAMLIYIADHGESLGEDGFFSHGQDKFRPEQRAVPLIIWASEEYKKFHADRYQSLQQKLTDNINHDVIFHSMIDCAGIEASVVDKKLSLCAQPL